MGQQVCRCRSVCGPGRFGNGIQDFPRQSADSLPVPCSHQPPVAQFPGLTPLPWCPSPRELPPPSPLGTRPRAAGRPLAPWLLSPRARAASCLCVQSNSGLTRAHARPSPLTVTPQRYSQGRGVGVTHPRRFWKTE